MPDDTDIYTNYTSSTSITKPTIAGAIGTKLYTHSVFTRTECSV